MSWSRLRHLSHVQLLPRLVLVAVGRFPALEHEQPTCRWPAPQMLRGYSRLRGEGGCCASTCPSCPVLQDGRGVSCCESSMEGRGLGEKCGP